MYVEYLLTDKGYDAAKVLVALMAFGEAWSFGREDEPVRLFSRETGQRVRPELVDAESGDPIDVRRLYAGPGPSFPRAERVRRERFAEYYQRRAGPGPSRSRRP